MMGNAEREVFESVARAGREAVRRIWSSRDDRSALDPPARRLLSILELHPEFRVFWEGAEPTPEDNPFIHVMYHDLLEQQLEAGSPPEAREALARLIEERGLERHEALHELLRVLVLEMYRMASTKGRFDQEAYRARLEKLGRDDGPAAR